MLIIFIKKNKIYTIYLYNILLIKAIFGSKNKARDFRQSGSAVSSLVVLAALLINAVVIGAGGYYFWHQKKLAEKEIAEAQIKKEAELAVGSPEKSSKVYFKKIVSFEPLLTNLAGDNGRRILRVNMEVQVEGETVLEEIKKIKPILRDGIVSAAGSMDFEQASKPEGREKLKEKILQIINSHLTSGNKAVNVFYSSFETN